jgi:hypothetical protein
MPVCKNDPAKKYKGTEPSPKGLGFCAHSEKVGTTKKGKDENNWIVKQVSNGSKRWMKIKSEKITNDYKNRFVSYKKVSTGWFSSRKTTSFLDGLTSDDPKMIYKWIRYNKFEKTPSSIPDGYRKIKINNTLDDLADYFGSKILLTEENTIYQKIKSQLKSYDTYFIYEQSGVYPYLVYINTKLKKVKIYISENNKKYQLYEDGNFITKYKWNYIKLIKEYKYKKSFIGKSILNNTTKSEYTHGSKYDGNTILLELSNNINVFIGNNIYEFKLSNDTITSYYSTLGRSHVPYPVAVSKDYIYLLTFTKFISKNNNLLNGKSEKDISDIHQYYMENQTDKDFISKFKQISIKMIHKGY